VATELSVRAAVQLQEYFDQLACHWDREVSLAGRKCLSHIIRELDLGPGSRVLDVGCGTGVLLPLLVEAVGARGRIAALDFSRNMLLEARAKGFQPIVSLVQADVTDIPLIDGYAHMVICNSAFPHFGDKAEALKEMARVLRDDGRLVICHTASRDRINQFHQSIGGAVGADLLPDEAQLVDLTERTGLRIVYLEDSPTRYLAIARKAIQVPD
jgi:ubiquinone/menaquinone biosynthesis C-methylase UbiE